MATKEERIEQALDVLAEIMREENPSDRQYERRAAAEEVLRHYREGDLVRSIKEDGLTVNLRVDGHIPVRPKVRTGTGPL